MQTTIKGVTRKIVVEPVEDSNGFVSMAIWEGSNMLVGFTLTQDQIGALIVGLEVAADKAVTA